MSPHETFMDRCIQLARLGAGWVAPNPMVGAVLVHDGRIIGEGYHKAYGGPHAEVHCLDSVSAADRQLITRSTLYVSLEPCAHFGKTPPCADLNIREGIPRVVVGCRDPFPAVNGKGIEKLKQAGVEVVQGVREEACRALNELFFTAHLFRRPFVSLKWAQSADGFIAGLMGRRMLISGPQAARVTHQLRATRQGILVGTNTALFDDPELTTRHWPGPHPVRLVLDRQLRLPASLHLFNGEQRSIVFNELRSERHFNLEYVRLERMADRDMVPRLLMKLYELGIHSLLVEGGAALLQCFLDSGIWDEAWRFTSRTLHLRKGIPAPLLQGGVFDGSEPLGADQLDRFRRSPDKA